MPFLSSWANYEGWNCISVVNEIMRGSLIDFKWEFVMAQNWFQLRSLGLEAFSSYSWLSCSDAMPWVVSPSGNCYLWKLQNLPMLISSTQLISSRLIEMMVVQAVAWILVKEFTWLYAFHNWKQLIWEGCSVTDKATGLTHAVLVCPL